MTFNVAADAYDSFMGRFSVQLSAQLADLAGIDRGQRVIDVGSGPGALTTELVRRLGPDAVAAADPSEPFVEAARERHPGVDVRLAPADKKAKRLLEELRIGQGGDRQLGEKSKSNPPGKP